MPEIKQLLEKYIGDIKEVYRRCSEQSICIVMDCGAEILATLQLKPPGLILLNIEVGGENSSKFNHEVKHLLCVSVKVLNRFSNIF